MSDPHDRSGLSVTIKHDGSKEAPWLVFHGSPDSIRENIIATFGMDAGANEFTLHELVLEAGRMAYAAAQAATTLGGRVIKKAAEPAEQKSQEPVSTEGENAWQQGQQGQQEQPPAEGKSEEAELIERLKGEVAKVTTVAALQELWARNQKSFEDASLMDAYKAKGRSLTPA